MPEVSYYDDCLFPIFSKHDMLLANVASYCSIVHRVFAGFGFGVNYGEGKTEARLYLLVFSWTFQGIQEIDEATHEDAGRCGNK